MELINKKILLTGATSGIGLKLLEQLYEKNTLYIIAKDQNKIENLLIRFPDLNVLKTNLTDVNQVKNAVIKLNDMTDSLDLLINNAAVQHTAKFTDEHFNIDLMLDEINCNFTSICMLSYLILPILKRAPIASIVNINSGLGLMPKTTSAVYCATKAAINSLSQSLRYQLVDTNINVYQAFLPMVDTPMTYGRGNNKLSPEHVSYLILKGIEHQVLDNDIGKVKLLRLLIQYLPFIAKRIMRDH